MSIAANEFDRDINVVPGSGTGALAGIAARPKSDRGVSTAELRSVDAGLSEGETYSTDAALASDPAWLLPGRAPDPAGPRNLHPEPIPPSDLPIDNNVPASQHRVDPS
jgi:hypothetical protein